MWTCSSAALKRGIHKTHGEGHGLNNMGLTIHNNNNNITHVVLNHWGLTIEKGKRIRDFENTLLPPLILLCFEKSNVLRKHHDYIEKKKSLILIPFTMIALLS